MPINHIPQSLPHLRHWHDYGIEGTEDLEPYDWRKGMLREFGSAIERQGFMDGEQFLGLGAETEYYIDEETGEPRARTPMIELSSKDYEYVRRNRKPYAGMLGLGDDGQVYAWDGLGGFFKRLWKKAKKAVKRVGKRLKKFVKKLPGGKYLVKLGEKVHKISMKLVKPLTKFVGKYAAKLAPVAALIPGVGPAVSAAMFSAGKVAKLMNKYGVAITGGNKKTPARLTFKKPQNLAKFKRELERQARLVRR